MIDRKTTGFLESVGRFCFLKNSARIQPIELKFGFLVVRVRGFFLKKHLLNLVVGLPRNDSAKTTLGFLRHRHGHGPHEDIPAGVLH